MLSSLLWRKIKKKKKTERKKKKEKENSECRLSAFDWRIAATFTPPFSTEIVPSSKEQSLVVWPCSATCNERRWCLSLGADLGAGWYIRSSGPNQPPTYDNPVYALLRRSSSLPPSFLSPPRHPRPLWRAPALSREKSVSAWWQWQMKRDGWRVVPFVSRLSHVSTKGIPFSRDLSDQCGGERKKETWIVSSLISGSSWISVWVILYVYIRSCIGGLDLGCWVWDNWGRLDLCKIIKGRSDI